MALQTESLKKLTEDDWVLVTYDIKGRFYSDPEEEQQRIDNEIRAGATEDQARETISCDKRNIFRDKLRRLGAVRKNDSVYFVPAKLAEKKASLIKLLKDMGKEYGVQITAIGVNLDDEEEIKTLSNQFTENLKLMLKDMNENLKESNKKMKSIEDDVERDPKKKLTGAYRILEGVSNDFTEVQGLINKWGNEDDQWDLDSLKFKVLGLIERWNKVRAHKKLDEQEFDLSDKGVLNRFKKGDEK